MVRSWFEAGSKAIALFVVTAVAGCGDSTAPGELPVWPDPEYRQIYGGGLRLSLFEAPGRGPVDSAGSTQWAGVGEPRIVLAIKTLSEWDCGGSLESDLRQGPSGGAITVEVKRVFPHVGACASYAAPAVFLPVLPIGLGEHTLRVLALGETHEFRLRVSDAVIDVLRVGPAMPEALLRRRLVKEDYTTFWRFPARSLAFYCDASAAPEVCDAVARLLVSSVGLTPFQFGTDGHLPFPTPEAGSPMQVRYFLYPREEDLRAVTVQLCSASDRARLTMGFISWRNEASTCPR